jgi:hypothetical protein
MGSSSKTATCALIELWWERFKGETVAAHAETLRRVLDEAEREAGLR